MPASLEELRRLEIPGLARFAAGAGGLPRLEITTRLATAHIYLHGAHVTHFQPAGFGPVLFLSSASRFAAHQAIRGGVPVIFPWFGPNAQQPSLPMHGVARTAEWEVEGVETWPDQTCQATFRLLSSEPTHAVWPFDFILRLRVTVSKRLELSLEVENWSGQPFTYEEALHTYLAVRDVRQTKVTGLQGADYLDKANGYVRRREDASAISFQGETDRVYLNTEASCGIDDPSAARLIRVAKEGSRSTVVWNPWEAKAAALADLGKDVRPEFVCLETANAGENAVTLQHGETHVMRAVISVA